MRGNDPLVEDYFRAASATNVGVFTYGAWVPLAGIVGWSFTAYTKDGAKANLVVDFTDFRAGSIALPDDVGNMSTRDVTSTIAGTAGTATAVRTGRFEDGTCSAAQMRVSFQPTTGSLGTLWLALSLRAA